MQLDACSRPMILEESAAETCFPTDSATRLDQQWDGLGIYTYCNIQKIQNSAIFTAMCSGTMFQAIPLVYSSVYNTKPNKASYYDQSPYCKLEESAQCCYTRVV